MAPPDPGFESPGRGYGTGEMLMVGTPPNSGVTGGRDRRRRRVEKLVSRLAHNQEIAGSSPAPATQSGLVVRLGGLGTKERAYAALRRRCLTKAPKPIR